MIKGLTESQIKLFFQQIPLFFCLFFSIFLPFLSNNSETILQIAIFGEKQKNFFFWKLYQNAKNPIVFDFLSKNLLGHKLRFFLTNTPFFAYFDHKFRNHSTNGHFGWKIEKIFLFWKLYQNAKNPVAFDFWSKNLLGHKLSYFPTNTPFFALFDQKFRNHPTNGHFGWKTEKLFFLKTLSKCLKVKTL